MAALKGIWASARELGMTDEELHLLCKSVTGEDSLKNLNKSRSTALMNELVLRKCGRSTYRKTPREYKTDGMTQAQCGKAFALMYELAKRDREPSSADIGERLCGVVRKMIKKLSEPGEPFQKLNVKDGIKLINILERYIESADKKNERTE